MKTILLSALSFLAIGAFAQNRPSSCSAAPWPVNVQQPDGSSLQIVGEGNNWVSWSRTTDGYTVIQNQRGEWVYGTTNSSGDLVESPQLAHDPNNRSQGETLYLQSTLRTGLTYSKSQKDALLKQAGSMSQGLNKQGSNAFPLTGKPKILMILIQYPDQKATYADSMFFNMMNEHKYNGSGSFRDYYYDVSNGAFEPEVDVVGWFTARDTMGSYGRKVGDYRAQELVAEAIDSAEAAGVDFSKYDNDKDGTLDGLLVVHSGPGAEEGSQLRYIWSHRWNLMPGNSRNYDNINIDSYCINPETRWYGKVNIGVYCHEFGHILGLPDLYDTSTDWGNGAGIGEWGLMGSCGWLSNERAPCHMESWSKYSLGWMTPETIYKKGVYTLDTFARTHAAYRINTSNPDEYFLLENRQKVDFDSSIKGHGLAIFHIDETRAGLLPSDNKVNDDTSRLGVALEQADGLRHLEKNTNRSDAGDLYPGSMNRSIFGTSGFPNSNLNLFHQSSGIEITQIQENDGIVSFRIGGYPTAAIGSSPLNGCAPHVVFFYDQSSFGDSVRWDFGDTTVITTAPGTNPSHIYQHAGTYKVWQRIIDENGDVVDSTWKSVFVDPAPEAAFTYTSSSNFDFVFTAKPATSVANQEWDFNGSGIYTRTGSPVSQTFSAPGYYRVVYRITNFMGCQDTVSQLVGVYPVGIQENLNVTQLFVYPNPSEGTVYLQSYEDILQVTVFAMDGRELRSCLPGNDHRIELADLPGGLYQLRIQTVSGMHNRRILLQR